MPRTGKHTSLQRKFMIVVGAVVAVLSLTGTVSVAWMEKQQVDHSIRELSRNELNSMHSLIVSVMAKRPTDPDDISIGVYNDWFRQRNKDFAGEVWSVWSPQVAAHMAVTSSNVTPKTARDDVDRAALETRQIAEQQVDGGYRMAMPIVLGVTPGAEQEVCFSCHEAMGLKKGDVIAVMSARISTAAEDSRLRLLVFKLLGGGALFTVLAMIGVRAVLMRQVTGPVGKMTAAMERLAAGDTGIDIDGEARSDEIGAMARALAVFRANAEQRAALESAQADAAAARDQRMRRIDELVSRFERTVQSVLATLSASSVRLRSVASDLMAVADATAKTSKEAAVSARDATDGARSVMEAAQRLTGAIDSIVSATAVSETTTHRALNEVEHSTGRIAMLEETTRQVAGIVDMIKDIAHQTGMLSLNATIEAARAGEAGKGFAVVASEVKSLAGQTMRATDEIMARVAAIQDGTRGVTEAFASVSASTGEINHSLGAITQAVRLQEQETRSIAWVSNEAAGRSESVARSVDDVAEGAERVDGVGHSLGDIVAELTEQSRILGEEVARFLDGIRRA